MTPSLISSREFPSPVFTQSVARGIVAVVEDDAQMAQALVQWLQLIGIGASHHVSGETLLRELRPVAGSYVLAPSHDHPAGAPLLAAVLDLNLPGMTGVELAHQLRQHAPTIPLAIITGLREIERAPFGHPPRGVEFLQKPFDLDSLEDLLFPLK